MEKQSVTTLNHLDKLSPLALVSDPKIGKRFVESYKIIHGKDGEAMYQKEQFNFIKLLQENPSFQECTKLSLYASFLDLAINGLSLDNTSKPLCYMMSRNIKIKGPNGDFWEKRAYIKVSPYGEIYYRKRAGQIKNADNPQIVWEGDTIKVGLNEQGKHVVKLHERQIPRKENARILGGYMRIERHDGSFECTWMDVQETERLREYSNRNNKGTDTEDKSNKLYTSYHGQIDPGFFEAKIMRHAFDSYPPVKLGQNSVLETAEEPELISYELEPDEKPESFAKPIEEPKPGIQFNDNEEGSF